MPESPGIITSRMASRGGLASIDWKRRRAVLDRLDVVPGLGQLEDDEVADVPVVVGDQDAVLRGGRHGSGQLLPGSASAGLRQKT